VLGLIVMSLAGVSSRNRGASSTNKNPFSVFDGLSVGLAVTTVYTYSSMRLLLEWGRRDRDRMRREKRREEKLLWFYVLDSMWEDQQDEMDHGAGRSLSMYIYINSLSRSNLEMVMRIYEHKPQHLLLRSPPPPS